MLKLNPMELWQLRADAADGVRLTLEQIGRVIMHINARRGYRHSKEDAGADSKQQSDYLKDISTRAQQAEQAGLTPGQYFAQRLRESEVITPNGRTYTYRIKEKVFPRRSYEQELHRVLKAQQNCYPDVLTDNAISEIENAVFFQRPLKSCKHLVSICEFEAKEIRTPDGKRKIVGPRVAPVSSPLFQVERMWEAINNIVLKNYTNKRKRKPADEAQLLLFGDARKYGFEYRLTASERQDIFGFLNDHDQMKSGDLLKILRLKKDDGFSVPANIAKGLKGNRTRMELKKALADMPGSEKFLRFDLHIEESGMIDAETGEVLMRISNDYLCEPLYQLWHTIYSISDKDELRKALKDKFGIVDERVTDKLFNLDFRGAGYGNKSSKFICRILPYLMNEGLDYSEACERVGVNHSDSLTAAENDTRELADALPLLKKGDLRQPVVEKILNQMINLVNSLMEKFGRFDEIRIELARELKRSKDERSADYERNTQREKENKRIADQIIEFGLRPSVNKIQKYRMWQEAEMCCMYCGQPVGVNEFLRGIEAEKEHVIPRSIFFDDSFSNKVCACRKCNHEKGQLTGYDFMASKGDSKLHEYIERVERLHMAYKTSHGKSGISKTKHDRLLTSRNDIPQDFIERDLRMTQYISRKSMELLRTVCRNVYATSGSVTDFLRHIWGYDEILHNLNLRRYSDAEQTECVEYTHHGHSHTEERIIGWTKRLDHRHHAVDALTIALTRQGYIQRLNTLNTIRDNEESYTERFENLEKWAASRPHIGVAEARRAIEEIAVSFKAGKRLFSPGKRYIRQHGKRICVQNGLIVPRGPLSEESVYGKNLVRQYGCALKSLFSNPDAICDPAIKQAVIARLKEYAYDEKKAVASCKKMPLIADGQKTPVSKADMWSEEFVIRYPLEKISSKKVKDIIDTAVREAVAQRFRETGNDDKAFVKSLAENPIYHPGALRTPIKSVRCYTGLRPDSMTAVRKDNGHAFGYAKFGSNHHVALYTTPDGNIEECIVPFAVALERRRLGLSVVVERPEELWQAVYDLGDELPNDFLARFPKPDWRFITSMQVNEMFIVGLSDDEIRAAVENGQKAVLANNLYRVQRLSTHYYDFKRHTSTLSDTTSEQMANKNYISIRSFGRWAELNPVKIKVDRLGNMILPEIYIK